MKSYHAKVKTLSITKHVETERFETDDSIATEEPMEIRLVFGPPDKRIMRPLTVTMRTPGNDEELAAGFLFTEGVLSASQQIQSIEIRGVDDSGQPTDNIVRVELHPDVEVGLENLQRNFFSSSSCGVCGKASLASLELKGVQPLPSSTVQIPAELIYKLPAALRSSQPTFDETGGIHAACLADFSGNILETREDIGRHNAVDKLIGAYFQQDLLPASEQLLVVSGRAGFEIVQKAIVAGVPVMVAVGAPSSLAVELARRFNMTLIGFANERRFNVYAGSERVA